MPRVLMITNRFIFGGIEKLLLDVFENKENSSIHYDLLTLVTEKDDELIERIEACGVRYFTLALDKHSTIERQFYHYKALYDFVKKGHYDVVHINITSYARVLDMMVIKKAGVKMRIIHSHSAAERDPLHRKFIRPIRKLYDYYATVFLACSDEAAKHLFSKKVYEEKKYHIICNGINVNNYKYSDEDRKRMRKELGLTDTELLLGHVGRLTEAKNHLFILEVFSEINKLRSNSKLLLVGDGELRCEVEKKIDSLQLREKVILYGASSSIATLLSSMDIFLFPSIWEGLGISVIEAQSNGLPCYISENVPKAAAITSNVYQYNLEKGAKWWAEMILQNDYSRVKENDKIVEAGYDVCHTVRQLEKLYMESCK